MYLVSRLQAPSLVSEYGVLPKDWARRPTRVCAVGQTEGFSLFRFRELVDPYEARAGKRGPGLWVSEDRRVG